MIINKLAPSVRLPLKFSKGSAAQRQEKAQNFASELYKNLMTEFRDNYSIMSYSDLEKQISKIIPDKNYKVIVKELTEEKAAESECNALCQILFNNNHQAQAHSIDIPGINHTIRSVHLPEVLHEIVHIADNMFNPKLVAREQKINLKNMNTKKYEKFYDDNYYCGEIIESKQDKKDALKIIENKTRKFLKGLSTSDKIDYIQDMRYSLMSEINAYKFQVKTAQELKENGFMIKDYEFDDMSEIGLYKDKIKLLKKLAIEFIEKERAKHASKVKKHK